MLSQSITVKLPTNCAIRHSTELPFSSNCESFVHFNGESEKKWKLFPNFIQAFSMNAKLYCTMSLSRLWVLCRLHKTRWKQKKHATKDEKGIQTKRTQKKHLPNSNKSLWKGDADDVDGENANFPKRQKIIHADAGHNAKAKLSPRKKKKNKSTNRQRRRQNKIKLMKTLMTNEANGRRAKKENERDNKISIEHNDVVIMIKATIGRQLFNLCVSILKIKY